MCLVRLCDKCHEQDTKNNTLRRTKSPYHFAHSSLFETPLYSLMSVSEKMISGIFPCLIRPLKFLG